MGDDFDDDEVTEVIEVPPLKHVMARAKAALETPTKERVRARLLDASAKDVATAAEIMSRRAVGRLRKVS